MTDTAKYWGCAYPPARPVRRGTSSSPTWSPEASPACAWSPATPIWAWLKPSPPTCPEPPGNDAAPTTPLISCRSPPKHYGPPSKRCCTRCTTSPTRHRSTLNTTGSWTTCTTSSPPPGITSIKPGQTSSRSRPFPPGCGPRSGPTTPMSASTAKSAAAPTPWGSSPTARPSSAWSEPSSPNKTTNGPKADATSASTSSPNHDSHHNPPNRRTPHSNSAHNPTRRTQNDYTTPQDLTALSHITVRSANPFIAAAGEQSVRSLITTPPDRCDAKYPMCLVPILEGSVESCRASRQNVILICLPGVTGADGAREPGRHRRAPRVIGQNVLVGG